MAKLRFGGRRRAGTKRMLQGVVRRMGDGVPEGKALPKRCANFGNERNSISGTAIVRVEQLYPFDEAQVKAAIAPFTNAKVFVWCQEESQNMGAWSFVAWRLRQLTTSYLWYAGRDASASPAVGSLGLHKQEQARLIQSAFTLG